MEFYTILKSHIQTPNAILGKHFSLEFNPEMQ